MRRRFLFTSIAATSLVLLTSACDYLSTDKVTKRLPGNRISVMDVDSGLTVDEQLQQTPLSRGDTVTLESWPHSHATVSGLIGALELPMIGESPRSSATVGDGEGWDSPVAPAPVVFNGVVYVKDAQNYVSAHRADDIDEVLWRSDVITDENDEIIVGGGLAVDENAIYAVTGAGKIASLERKDGALLWELELLMPFRSAPKVVGRQLLVLSATNQLFSISTETGAVLWTHQGIAENSGYLSNASVAVSEEENIVIVPHSSGEIYALELRSGRPLWNDGLTRMRRTRASSLFSGIHAQPVIAGDIVYAIASNGLMVANRVQDGRTIWQRELSSLFTPWVAGDYVFVLTTDNMLVALQRFDGRIRWATPVSQLNDEEDEEEEQLFWQAPVVVGDSVWLMNHDDDLYVVNIATGQLVEERDIEDGLAAEPVFVGSYMYTIQQNGQLLQYGPAN